MSTKKEKKLDPRVERLLLLILEAEQSRCLREAIEGKDLDGEDLEVATAAPERAAIR